VIRCLLFALCLAALSSVAEPRDTARQGFSSEGEFLEFVQRKAFDYFWLEANPSNGLVRDRSRTNSYSSIAAVGFGLTAICVAIDHQWITRAEGRARVLATLKTFREKPQGPQADGVIGCHGWFYHFLDMNSGLRAWKCELSSIDTALLLAGVLYLREYFDAADPDEAVIRGLANGIYGRIDWLWMTGAKENLTRLSDTLPRRPGEDQPPLNPPARTESRQRGEGPTLSPSEGEKAADGRVKGNQSGSLSMGWHPERGFIERRWIGYNEAMILYLLALGSPTNPLPPHCWKEWTRGYQWTSSYGQSFVHFPPLFGHQYSHCWIDFRRIADDFMRGRGIDYFENSRRATLAQHAYCIANPGGFRGYSEMVWGLTASDGPGFGKFRAYSARGAPPPEDDDGTIAPTAVGGSIPFAPEICLPTLRHFYEEFRTNIWTPYGFCDAFNLTANWWDPEVLGIDQGPILIMIENYRTGRVWKTFMKAPEIRRGLTAAGFKPTNL